MIRHGLVEFRQISHPSEISASQTRELVECWITVANTGGAVGFAFPPVGLEQVAPVAERLIADLDPQRSRLLLAVVDGALAGWLNLSRHVDPLVAHWGTVNRVQTHPGYRRRGIGAAMMHRVRQIGRDEMGLEQLRLCARGGVGLEDFYGRLGWKEIGRWPGALRFGAGDGPADAGRRSPAGRGRPARPACGPP
ncbi:GNAT family N-acetyltransferase [Micromonospora sp. AP08]|uniref:GNAT family N-acetyltransferase n=1 Tax=Micromonospora sp. AP08 TaxID=2604467 RepID=UPI0011D885A4|nr:GNAT family N-acetyltransferase [Micromonospora sp. AP08]TYB39808.1 GNAT family N-acetyltransferase [Micromonospora sp. AP08]